MRTLRDQLAGRCVHFTGCGLAADRKTCRAGIEYRSLTPGPDEGWVLRLPCLKIHRPGPLNGPRGTCASLRFPTSEEVESEVRAIETRLREHTESLRRGECPTCKTPVERIQVGRCVYGSCGHRLYQGRLPKKERA